MKKKHKNSLEEVSREHKKNKYNLYQLSLFENRSRIVSSISQHEVSCIDKEVTLNLISKEAVTHLRK